MEKYIYNTDVYSKMNFQQNLSYYLYLIVIQSVQNVTSFDYKKKLMQLTSCVNIQVFVFSIEFKNSTEMEWNTDKQNNKNKI